MTNSEDFPNLETELEAMKVNLRPCPDCKGTGGNNSYTCSTCEGEGYLPF
jgi:DnaJ-class molecular chaperone